MAVLKFADRVAEVTTYSGTGDITLNGAIDTDHDTFGNQFADAEEMPVSVFGGGKWMTFRGRYNSGANSLTRVTFRDSSTGSNLALSGTMTVMCGWGAADAAAMIRTDEAQSLTDAQKGQARTNIRAPTRTITGTDTIVALDHGKTLILDSATAFTLAVTAAATLGDGFWCNFRNINLGLCTIDPNAAELIDGQATIIVPKGDSGRLFCAGGAAFYTSERPAVVLIESGVLAAQASVTFKLPPGFAVHELFMEDVVPVANTALLNGTLSNNGGSSFITSAYKFSYNYSTDAPAVSNGGNNSAVVMLLSGSVDNTSNLGVSVQAKIFNAALAEGYFKMMWEAVYPAAGVWTDIKGLGVYPATGPFTDLKVVFSSGNIASGRYQLYGHRRVN